MLALGDSHIKMLSYIPLVTSIISVPGATAYGLTNSNSQTDARNVFIESLNESCPVVITCLGEVDCNVLYWRMKNKYKVKLLNFLSDAISNYFNFLRSLNHNIIVLAVPLPVIDNYNSGAYSLRACKPRADIKASKEERTNVVNLFNDMLESNCAMHGIGFINYIPDISDEDGLKMKYAKGIDDSHLNPKMMKDILTKHIIEKANAYK